MDPELASYIHGLTATNLDSTCPELLLLGPCSHELCHYLGTYLEKKKPGNRPFSGIMGWKVCI